MTDTDRPSPSSNHKPKDNSNKISKKMKQSPDRVEAAAKLPASPMSTSSKSQPSTPVNNDDPSTWTKSKKKQMRQKRKREEEAAKKLSMGSGESSTQVVSSPNKQSTSNNDSDDITNKRQKVEAAKQSSADANSNDIESSPKKKKKNKKKKKKKKKKKDAATDDATETTTENSSTVNKSDTNTSTQGNSSSSSKPQMKISLPKPSMMSTLQKAFLERLTSSRFVIYKKIVTTWRRFTLHDLVLLSNLELDYAKLLQEASNSTSNMLRKTLQAFKYPDSYTVKLERSSKNVYTLVLQLSRQLDRYHEMKLKDIFAKYNCEGFAKWLGGMTGWYYSPGVNEWGQFIIARLNDLQSVVKTYAPPELLYCFPGESKTLVWCKRQDLRSCVIDVRFFVERAKKKLPGTSSARRLKLLQNSNDGPDSLVHWAHHDPQNNYPLTVVTAESMGRLIELLVELLLQVLPRDADERLNGILATLFRNKNTQQHQVSSSSISVDLG